MSKFSIEDHEKRIREILNPPVKNNMPASGRLKLLMDRLDTRRQSGSKTPANTKNTQNNSRRG